MAFALSPGMDTDWMLAFFVAELVVLALVWLGERRQRHGRVVVGVVAAAMMAAAVVTTAVR